jgi:DNA-binding CsgD family transcriptional regulator
MSRNTSRFETAVETFQNSSDMSEAEAEVYVLRFLNGVSRSEAADQLDKSESTVDTQYQSAQKKAQLPNIDTVKRVSATNTGYDEGAAYEIWFENESMLRYVWNEERGHIFEDTIAADDPHSIHKSSDVRGSQDELAEYTLESIIEYTRSYRDEPEVCRKDWPHVFEAITLYGA